MSIVRGDMNDGAGSGVSHLLARGAGDDVRADRRLRAVIDDLALPGEYRLDDRTRLTVQFMAERLCALVEGDVRQVAARRLVAAGMPEHALRLTGDERIAYPALIDAGILYEPAIVRELLGRAGQALLADALPLAAPEGEDQPSLLVRLAEGSDDVVAAAAAAMLVADARRRDALTGPAPRGDISAEVHHRLVWSVTAALQLALSPLPEADQAALDTALTDAAERALIAHDEGDRAEAVAHRLATALSATDAELPQLLTGALGDRRVPLFVALLAYRLGLADDAVRDALLDPAADRLWLMLRAAALDRPTIGAIGLALCDADPRRDVESFAESLDAIMAVTPAAARTALAPLYLHPDLRTAREQLRRAR